MPVRIKGGGGAGFPLGWKENFKGVVHEAAIMKGDPVVCGTYGDLESGMDSISAPPLATSQHERQVIVSPNQKLYVSIGFGDANLSVLFKNDNDTYTSVNLSKPTGSNTSAVYKESASFSYDGKYLAMSFISGSYYLSGIYEINYSEKTATMLWQTYSPSAPALKQKFIDLSDGAYYLIYFRYGTLYLRRFNGISEITEIANKQISLSAVIESIFIVNKKYIALLSSDASVQNNNIYEITPTGISDAIMNVYSTSRSTDLLAITESWQYAALKDASYVLTLVKNDGNNVFTKLANPAILPTSPTSAAFDPSGVYLAVSSTAAPFLIIYKRTGDTFEKLPNPLSLPTGQVWFVKFSEDSTLLCVVFKTDPFIYLYSIETGKLVSKITSFNATPLSWFPYNRHKIGVALDSGNIGAEIRVNLFPTLSNL